jgi:hypothetical protein
MATLNRLTPRKVATAKDGWHADGGNIYLKVDDGGQRRRWVFRFTRNGKVTERAWRRQQGDARPRPRRTRQNRR